MPEKPNKDTVAIVVPIFNEEVSVLATIEKLKAIIQMIPAFQFEIICVNDGSSDRTEEILSSVGGITVVNHGWNRGYGAALHTGITSSNTEWIAIVDSDETYPIEQLKDLTEETTRSFDMVVGARRGIGITKSPHKRFARWILRRTVWALSGVMIPDLNSGMRVFRRTLYDDFRHLLPTGFSFTSTLTVASLYCGFRVRYLEIPYSHRTGTSHIRPIQDFFGFLMLIVRLASYFEPMRFFFPIAIFLIVAAVGRGIRDIWVNNALGGAAVIVLVSGIQVFLTGILADVIVRRSYGGVLPIASLKERKSSVEIDPQRSKS